MIESLSLYKSHHFTALVLNGALALQIETLSLFQFLKVYRSIFKLLLLYINVIAHVLAVNPLNRLIYSRDLPNLKGGKSMCILLSTLYS